MSGQFLVDYPRKTLWFLILYIPASTRESYSFTSGCAVNQQLVYVNSLLAMYVFPYFYPRTYTHRLRDRWNARRHVMSSSTRPTDAGSLSTWQINVNTAPED